MSEQPTTVTTMTEPALPETLIALHKVEKSYPTGPTRSWVLRQIDLAIAPGEFVTFMGPSGAGKTTLLSILGMLDGEFEGEYWFGGEAVHALKPRARQELHKKHIGFVFQHYHLLDDLTVYENLELPLSYRDVPRKERQGRVAEALDRFGIVAKKDLYPSQLSGGQQQLVAVARAVIAEPRLILADEPTGSLHSSQGTMIMELLGRLNEEGVTIVQVTHDDRVAGYGRRTVLLKDGWIVDRL
ncbi:MAG TPA: ABC transporter ATP-binding protein [Thermoanaerobaculia bacterium]|jgi:ABC-type lipoprotein export system ATPase subunit|nr:ABC transporter ATP-binding protein [Thermoanaerobaculia bacterium]